MGEYQPRLLIVAGEASGDAHAARLVQALAGRRAVHLRGAGGPALRAQGVETLVDMSELNVLGFSAVLRRLPALMRALERLRDSVRRDRPDAALLVDSPGFNFRLGPWLHARGIPVFYYIAPQVWAWHPERAAQMARWVTRLAVVFPFEEPLFRDAGVDARFVGHPLLETLAAETDAATLRREVGAGAGARLLGILPGSRPQEIRAHVPVLLDAAARLAASRRDLVTLLPLAPGLEEDAVARWGDARLERAADGRTILRRGAATAVVVRGRTRSVMAHAAACAVASGTATLETALFATPLAIVYRVGAVNYWIARRLVRLPRIGLPNIVAGEEVAPELIQAGLTPARLAETLAPWLDDPARREAASARLRVVRARLGEPGASDHAARWLEELLPHNPDPRSPRALDVRLAGVAAEQPPSEPDERSK